MSASAATSELNMEMGTNPIVVAMAVLLCVLVASNTVFAEMSDEVQDSAPMLTAGM